MPNALRFAKVCETAMKPNYSPTCACSYCRDTIAALRALAVICERAEQRAAWIQEAGGPTGAGGRMARQADADELLAALAAGYTPEVDHA